MHKFIPIWAGLLLCLLCTTAMAQQPTLEWAQRFNSLGNTSDYAISVAVDAEGNSYVTGTSTRQGYLSVIITIKYAPSGEQLWVAQYREFSSARGIAVDNAGGVYVIGESNGDYLTVRYDAASGEQSWAQRYDGPSNNYDQAVAIAVDNAGGVYVTGLSVGSDYDLDYVTVRYDAVTGDEVWMQRYDGPANSYDQAAAIAVDKAGGVYVTGISYNTEFLPDYATVRYNATTGEQTWVQLYDGPGSGYDEAIAIATDNTGSVYVTGTSTDINYIPDYATIRYNAATGEQLWVQRYDGPSNSYDQATAIAVDNAGGVYVTGSSYGTEFNPDFATIRYAASTGEQTWVQHYNGLGDSYESARAIVVDDAGGVYVFGVSSGMELMTDYATVRYEAATGEQSWEQRYNGPANGEDQATAMAVGGGGVVVTGASFDRNFSSDYATVRYDATTGEESWVQRYDSLENSQDYPVSVAVDAEGNSYVTGTSVKQGYLPQLTTVKYAPSGEQLWVVYYDNYSEARGIAVDNQGGVFVTGNLYSGYLTIRYDGSTGEKIWEQYYSEFGIVGASAAGIAVDNKGGVYVTGYTYDENYFTDYATVRYDANTGAQTWAQTYTGPPESVDIATAIAVDNSGGVYVTGRSYDTDFISDYLTVRYDAATGEQHWVQRYDGPARGDDEAVAIAADNAGGVYVTGNSSQGGHFAPLDYATVRYDATTGEQHWVQRYDGPGGDRDEVTDIVVDNAGSVYVTGGSYDSDFTVDYATIRYDASTGEQIWLQRYNGGFLNVAFAIAVDNSGGVYVTGTSYSEASHLDYATLRYEAATGEQTWVERYATEGTSAEVAIDMALDSRGNILITGYIQDMEENVDFLTIKYSQCQALAQAPITGSSTAAVNTARATYTIPGSGASSFTWSITGSDEMPFTDFTGQGTGTVAVNWPSVPGFYKVTVTYGGGPSCPAQTAVMYVHVFDPEAGFVTGNGWTSSPVNKEYAFMQESKRAHWSFSARYMKGPENKVQGATHFMLQAGAFAFRSTSIDDETLVISGNTAFFRGRGTASYTDNSGRFVTDPRQFGYQVAATDGQFQENSEADKFRLMVWVINEDGSQGAVVYDNQLTCLSAVMDENSLPCNVIDQGSIVIHKPNARSVSRNALLTAAIEPGLEAYPTAFSERTTIAFALAEDATAYTLDLYDLKGTLVQRIAAGTAASERRYAHELQAGSLAKGLYLARLTAGGKVQTVKLVVQR